MGSAYCATMYMIVLFFFVFFCRDPNLKIVCARVIRHIEIKTGGLR